VPLLELAKKVLVGQRSSMSDHFVARIPEM
jgi:hypothetical protein